MNDGNAFDSSDSESDTEATENTCSSCQETFLSNCKGVSVFKCLCRLCHDNYKKETLKNIENDSSDDNEEDFQLPPDVVNKSPDETVDTGCGDNFRDDITNDIDTTFNDEVMNFSHDCDAVSDAMTSSVLNDRNNNMKSGVVEEQDVVVDNIDDEVNNVEKDACDDNVVDGIAYSISSGDKEMSDVVVEMSEERGSTSSVKKNTDSIPSDIKLPFFNKHEMSIELNIGGFSQCYVKHRFKMDNASSVVRLYCDLGLNDRAGSLYYYIMLSAHFNQSTKSLILSRCVARNIHNETKVLVLTLLRTKCIKPRYDVVLMDILNDDKIFRVTITNFRKDYHLLVNEEFDDDYAVSKLCSWLESSHLIYDPRKGPNRTAEGHTESGTMDNGSAENDAKDIENVYDAAPSRKSVRAKQNAEKKKKEAIMEENRKELASKRSSKAKKENETRAKQRKQRTLQKKKEELPVIDIVDNNDVSDDEDEGAFNEGNQSDALADVLEKEENEYQALARDYVTRVRRRKADLKARMMKFEETCDMLEEECNVEGQNLNLHPTKRVKVDNNDSSSSLHKSFSPSNLNNQVCANADRSQNTSKKHEDSMTFMQMQIIQNQTNRINRTRELELQNSIYESMFLQTHK